MTGFELVLADEQATARFGAALAPLLRAGDVVGLSGSLGAGKTTLARAIIGALTGRSEIPSPTFMLVLPYDAPSFTLYHFDLYRLEKPEDAFELGLEEALDGVSLIEWPERIAKLLPESTLFIRLEIDGEARRALVSGGGEWETRLSALTPDKERNA